MHYRSTSRGKMESSTVFRIDDLLYTVINDRIRWDIKQRNSSECVGSSQNHRLTKMTKEVNGTIFRKYAFKVTNIETTGPEEGGGVVRAFI